MSLVDLEPTIEADSTIEYAGVSYPKIHNMAVPIAITSFTVLELLNSVVRFQLASNLLYPKVQYLSNPDGTYTAIIESYRNIEEVIKGVL
jgi:hypothetical protein